MCTTELHVTTVFTSDLHVEHKCYIFIEHFLQVHVCHEYISGQIIGNSMWMTKVIWTVLMLFVFYIGLLLHSIFSANNLVLYFLCLFPKRTASFHGQQQCNSSLCFGLREGDIQYGMIIVLLKSVSLFSNIELVPTI